MSSKLLLYSLIGLVVLVLVFVGGMMANAPKATPQATPQVDGAVDAGVELIRQDMYLRLTEQSVQNDRIENEARMTATQSVFDATATAEQRAIDAVATQHSNAATQQAWQVTVQAGAAKDTATAQAQATATQMAILGHTATVQAQGTATAAHGTEQAPFVSAQQTAVFAQAESADLAASRERMTNGVLAWGPWVVVLAVVLGAGFMLWKQSQVGVIPTDANGRLQMMVIQDGRRKVVIQPGLLPGPIVELDGVTAMPAVAREEIQRETVRGAQIIEAVRSLPPGYNRQAMSLTGGLNGQQAQVNIQVVQPGQIGPVLDEVEGGLLED